MARERRRSNGRWAAVAANVSTVTVTVFCASTAECDSSRPICLFVRCAIIEQVRCRGAEDHFRAAQTKSPRRAVGGSRLPPKTPKSGAECRLCTAESAQTRRRARLAARAENTN